MVEYNNNPEHFVTQLAKDIDIHFRDDSMRIMAISTLRIYIDDINRRYNLDIQYPDIVKEYLHQYI